MLLKRLIIVAVFTFLISRSQSMASLDDSNNEISLLITNKNTHLNQINPIVARRELELQMLVNAGVRLYQGVNAEKNLEKAYRYFKIAFHSGNIDSTVYLAKMLYNGDGCSQNSVAAYQYLSLAMAADTFQSTSTTIYLAKMLYKGKGCDADLTAAYKYFTITAESGHMKSCEYLAHMSRSGAGCIKDLYAARKYFEMAVKAGSKVAKPCLANMYYHGQGGDRELCKALQIYEELADTGKCKYQYQYAKLLSIEAGQGRCPYSVVYKYLKKAADQNLCDALVVLVDLIKQNEIDVDPDEKIFIYNKYSADLYCNRDTQTLVADAFYNGKGTPRNYQLAHRYYQRAALSNHKFAQSMLAFMYCTGQGTEKNYEAGRMWYEKASDSLTSNAQYHLARLYHHGLGGDIDTNKAFYYYNLAAHEQHPQALYELGRLYELGKKIKGLYHSQARNISQALEYYTLSAELGLDVAQYYLGLLYLKIAMLDSDKIKLGCHYLQKAANQDHVDAMYELAMTRVNFIDTNLWDPQETIDILTTAAAKGHAGAKQFLNGYEN